jgi:hypothetical protein
MKKLILAALLPSILNIYILCSQEKSIVSKYEVGVNEIKKNRYALNIDGDLFFYYDKENLIKIDLNDQKIDSVYIRYDSFTYLNLLTRQDGISIISFNKKNQYNVENKKYIYLINFNFDLEPLDTVVFATSQESYLLEEDFNFISLFIDKHQEKFYFNDEFSQMTVAEKDNWLFETQIHTVVDPTSGITYQALKKNAGFISSSSNERLFLPDTSVLPTQFSVIKDKVIFQERKNIYYNEWENTAKKWNHASNVIYNPCRRYENGVYHVQNGTLFLNALF